MLGEWLKAMLATRGCVRPDGRWLYSYRLGLAEYESLRASLREAVRVTQISVLVQRNQYFAPLFVLYASEWWRREYDGGAWKWAPILASLGVSKDVLPPNERSGLVLSGFAYWGLRPTGEGKRYFGSVVAHGGLPLKLIGHGGSRLNAIMGAVLRQAARYGWNESQVVDAVSDHTHEMPDSLRHEEVFRLLARMVLTTLDLKERHQLVGSADPLGRLDQAEPNWRREYPLQIDDAAAVQLLTSLVKAASQASSGQSVGSVFQVARILSRSELGEWRLESRVIYPAVASADALAQQFGLGDGSVLPRYFEVDAIVGERIALTSGRLLLGSDRATVSLGAQRHSWSGREACDEHFLHLRSSGRDLIEGGVSLPGGGDLTDISAPWVFVEEGEAFRLGGIGDVRLPDHAAIVAIPRGAKLELLDDGAAEVEVVGGLSLDRSKELELWRVSGCVRVSDGNDTWVVKLAQTRKLSGSLVLEGRRVGYPSRPWSIFRGKPRVVRYDEQGGREVLRNGFRWFALGTRSAIDPAFYCGPVELQVFEDDERIGRFRLVLVKEHAKERFLSSAPSQDASIEFEGWGLSDLAVEPCGSSIGAVKGTGEVHVVTLHAAATPPKDALMHLRWPASPHELRVWMPYPASGGRAFDGDGTLVISGSVMSLRHAAGVRILVFDQNPDQPKRYEVELELKGDRELSRSGSSSSRRAVPLIKDFAELRLLDLYGEVEALLGMSSELDAFVKLTLTAGGKQDFSMSISRYDLALAPTVMGVALAGEDAKRFGLAQIQGCEVAALPILLPTEAPRKLKALMSEGVPCGTWSIEGLESELAPWLVYPAPNSALEFRPLCIAGGCVSDNGDEVTTDTVSDCALASAIRLPTAQLRRDAIDAVLVSMSNDYEHDSWRMLDGLWSAFGKLPLCSIDTFKVLATRPEVVVAMLVRSELPGVQLGDYVGQLKQQLGLTLELVGINVWRNTLARFSAYWTQKVGEDVAQLSLPLILKERLSTIATEFPSLQIAMEWLQFEWLDDPVDGVLQLHRDIGADPGIHLKRLWHGGDSLLQRVLLRGHADDTDWPEARFFKDMAVRAFGDAVSVEPERMRTKVALLDRFFWLENGGFKLSVANVPVLCALWCALDLPLDWWRDSSNRLALQRIRLFDPLWFEDAYRHAFAACIGLSLIEPAPSRHSGDAPRVAGGTRVHRVASGEVQRKRARVN